MTMKNTITLTSKERRRCAANPLPRTIPAIPSCTICPKNHPTSRVGLAIDIDRRPKAPEPEMTAPTMRPKARPLLHPTMESLAISHTRKMMSMRNERYPSGINLNASSDGSKKGLGSEYRSARTPACKNRSNPTTASSASNPSFTKCPVRFMIPSLDNRCLSDSHIPRPTQAKSSSCQSVWRALVES